jgi:putative ABC transport system ATP-binding protein
MNVLEVTEVSKIYGSKGKTLTTALQGISFSMEEGEFLGIMGPSGSRKSTLLNVLSTIDKPTSGDVKINGESVVSMKEKAMAEFRGENLGFIFQDYNLLDSLTLKDNIILPLTLAENRVSDIENRISEVADTLGITELLDKYPYEVSGGQKQRAAAARAIITKPKLILADEPTGALDSKSAKMLLQSIDKLNKENNATILMVTHDPLSASYCDRVIFIKDGRLFTEIRTNGNKKNLHEKILKVLSVIGGGESELI